MSVLQHDELKPLSKTFTDSLSELGNLKVTKLLIVKDFKFDWFMEKSRTSFLLCAMQLEHLPQDYNGSALTLIESLSRYLPYSNIKCISFMLLYNGQSAFADMVVHR